MLHLSLSSYVSPRRRRGLAPALALAVGLLAALLGTAPAALADTLLAGSPEAAGGAWMLHDGALRALDAPADTALALDLPDGADVASLALVDDGWVVAGSVADPATGTERLFALTGGFDGSAARALPLPRAVHPVQHSPVVLVDGGELAALAWLEGDGGQAMAVRAARWRGDHWGAPEQVSSRGPGSQVALHGVTLPDGSWLLTWAAFDGVDTEIVWSLHQGSGWLPVRQLSPPNDTPDSLPKLIAWDGGARVTWGRVEGNTYRVVTQEYRDGEWGPLEVVGGAGTLRPYYHVADGRLFLLYQESGLGEPPPGGRLWTVVEMDRAGRPLRRATAPVRGVEPPVLAPGRNALLAPGAPGASESGWRSRLRWNDVTAVGGAR
jgi:hypothetical protein